MDAVEDPAAVMVALEREMMGAESVDFAAAHSTY